jgi:uncharacterized membrane protein YoaT (DUF817 family)
MYEQTDQTRFARIRHALEQAAVAPGWRGHAFEFAMFGFKQGWACLFGGLMLALLLGTHLFYPATATLHRYDFLTLCALAIQIGMIVLRLETWREVAVIAIFHIVGTVMELFKTAAGSWIYPESSLLHIGPVPLFSGFMYAAVGSYIARVWRIFDFRFTAYPPRWTSFVLAAAIYINFFAHHWLPDIRIALFVIIALLFGRCHIWFRPLHRHRAMPLLLGWLLLALFIWFAENMGTFANAWTYPDQARGWHMVSPMKMGAWYLLMIVSFVLVSLVSPITPPETEPRPSSAPARRSSPES